MNFRGDLLSTMKLGPGALPGKMLLIEKNKIDAYFRSGFVKLGLASPCRVRKGIRIRLRSVRAPCMEKKQPINLFSIILDPTFTRKCT